MINWLKLYDRFESHHEASLTTSQRVGYGLIATLLECLVYFSIPLFQWREVYILPRSSLDFAIPFDEWAIIPYISLYFLILYAFLKSPSVAVPRLCKNICIVAGIAAIFYFFFPTRLERVDVAMSMDSLSQMIRLLYSFDTPLNCFPSQHCAIAVLCVAALMDTNKTENFVYFLWGLLIIWSTIAVQQHVTIDAVAGILIGLIVYWFGNKSERREMETL